MQCLAAGLHYQSDDLCVVSAEDPPRSWCLYRNAKLRADSLSLAPPGLPLRAFTEGGETKHCFLADEAFPGCLLPAAPWKALAIPRITRAPESRLRPASPLDAMRALVPWSVSEVPAAGNAGKKIMLRALARVRTYHLDVGTNPAQTMALLKGRADGF